jgi:hypothetical protein
MWLLLEQLNLQNQQKGQSQRRQKVHCQRFQHLPFQQRTLSWRCRQKD